MNECYRVNKSLHFFFNKKKQKRMYSLYIKSFFRLGIGKDEFSWEFLSRQRALPPCKARLRWYRLGNWNWGKIKFNLYSRYVKIVYVRNYFSLQLFTSKIVEIEWFSYLIPEFSGDWHSFEFEIHNCSRLYISHFEVASCHWRISVEELEYLARTK